MSRPRARLMVARSSGRPSRLLRSALGDELVDLVADLAGHAANDGAGGIAVVDRAIGAVEGRRIEEAFDQRRCGLVEARVETVDRLGQHRVAEAIDHMRELGDDRRVQGHVEAVRHQEDVDVRLDLAGELLEHEVLILHLGAELGRLEETFAVPTSASYRRVIGRQSSDVVDSHSLMKARSLLARTTSLVCSRAGCAPHGTRGARRSGRCSR